MQDTIAILIALSAGAFLARRGWQQLAKRKAGRCGACSNCPSNTSGNTSHLITLSPITPQGTVRNRENT